MKAIIIPGNDNTPITSNWYQYVKDELEKLGLEVIAENMPDPKLARKEIWIPFIKEKLSNDENSILIGHSSGAIAILKFLEENTCKLAILVGTYHSDLDDELEKKSGYFDEPWKWDQIKNNAEKIVIFASQDDPYIPISEPRLIKEKLDAEYHEYKDEGHFGVDVNKKEFTALVLVVKKALKAPNSNSEFFLRNVVAEYNKPFFGLYETAFIVLKKNLGYERALEIFRQIAESALGKAFDEAGFKKGEPEEFERVIGERDRSVGLRVEFPEVTQNKIVYRDYDRIFPNLQGHIELKDLVDILIGFKVNYILGKKWRYSISKHIWKGDEYTEYIITKD